MSLLSLVTAGTVSLVNYNKSIRYCIVGSFFVKSEEEIKGFSISGSERQLWLPKEKKNTHFIFSSYNSYETGKKDIKTYEIVFFDKWKVFHHL